MRFIGGAHLSLKANAALNARVPITQSDIDLAVKMVLAPRATHHLEIVMAGADQEPSETPPACEKATRSTYHSR